MNHLTEMCQWSYSFVFRTDFRQGIKRLKVNRYFIDPDLKNLLVFPSKTKFFDYEIYQQRKILLMDKVCAMEWIVFTVIILI